MVIKRSGELTEKCFKDLKEDSYETKHNHSSKYVTINFKLQLNELTSGRKNVIIQELNINLYTNIPYIY